jgi:hypothetical protein
LSLGFATPQIAKAGLFDRVTKIVNRLQEQYCLDSLFSAIVTIQPKNTPHHHLCDSTRRAKAA